MADMIILILAGTLENIFNAFVSVVPFFFGRKKLWCVDKRENPRYMFLPCLKKHDERHMTLVSLVLLELGHSMPG